MSPICRDVRYVVVEITGEPQRLEVYTKVVLLGLGLMAKNMNSFFAASKETLLGNPLPAPTLRVFEAEGFFAEKGGA